MVNLTIFFGDCDSSIACQAQQTNPAAYLVDHTNVNEFLSMSPQPGTVIYTSLADLPVNLEIVYQLLNLADVIIYSPPTRWSDVKKLDLTNPRNSIEGTTLSVLLTMSKIKDNVLNLDQIQGGVEGFLELADQRHSQHSQLWIAGCSHSHAVGVENNQRYGSLLANRLSIPVSFLTAPGSSIQWQADQILRSDIKKDDIVVWGLTSEARFPWWSNQNCVKHVNPNTDLSTINLPKKLVNVMLTEEHFNYLAVVLISQVQNYCNKIGAKLLLAGLLSSDTLSMRLGSINEFAQYFNFTHQKSYVDVGTDGLHPGPTQHVLYANFCYNQLKRLKYV
jgi:hypothetical protein